MKPHFVNTGGSKYETLNLSFNHKVWWWIPSLEKHHFFEFVDETTFIRSFVEEDAVLLIDHSQDPIKVEQFESLYYSQFEGIFEQNNINIDRIIVLEPSPSQQFYMTLGLPNYVSLNPRAELPKKFTHIMFNSVFLNYWRRWESESFEVKKEPERHFLSLCAKDRFNRRFVNYKIHENNLFHKGFVSHVRLPFAEETHDYEIEVLQSRENFNLDLYTKYGYEKYTLDAEKPDTIAKISSYCSLSNKVCFELVIDGEMGDYIWPTEKVMKPLYCKTPFLYAGSPYMMKYLKALGFRTFDKVFDESYDSELIYFDRIELIMANMRKLCNLSLKNCQKYMLLLEDVCEHNHKHFIQLNKGFNINRRINDALTNIFR